MTAPHYSLKCKFCIKRVVRNDLVTPKVHVLNDKNWTLNVTRLFITARSFVILPLLVVVSISFIIIRFSTNYSRSSEPESWSSSWISRCSRRLSFWHSLVVRYQGLLASLYLPHMSRWERFPDPCGIAQRSVAEPQEATSYEMRERLPVMSTPTAYHRRLQDKQAPSPRPPLHTLYIMHRGRRQQWRAKKPVAYIIMMVWIWTK